MKALEFGHLCLSLCLLLVGVHVMRRLFQKIKQPPFIGEILVGVLLGPFVLGLFSSELTQKIFDGGSRAQPLSEQSSVLSFMSWLGLLLLMFLSGSHAGQLIARENRRAITWLLSVGTPLPFLIALWVGSSSWIPLSQLMGNAQNSTACLLVLAISVSVTSIPVISRIFSDLGILHTRFAQMILGTAVLEDILLWGILAVATGLVQVHEPGSALILESISLPVIATLAYLAFGLFVGPMLLTWLHRQRWNLTFRSSPTAYLLSLCFLYVGLATLLDVNLVLAAFVAGFGVIGGAGGPERARFTEALQAIETVAFAVFIPLYFVMVGEKLVLGRDFSLDLFLMFLVASSALALASVGFAAWCSGFRGLDIANIAITTNARGGPGIVLATVAFDAGIINAAFYTSLVLTAIVTSQAAGLWLRYVLAKSWPLLSERGGA